MGNVSVDIQQCDSDYQHKMDIANLIDKIWHDASIKVANEWFQRYGDTIHLGWAAQVVSVVAEQRLIVELWVRFYAIIGNIETPAFKELYALVYNNFVDTLLGSKEPLLKTIQSLSLTITCECRKNFDLTGCLSIIGSPHEQDKAVVSSYNTTL